MTLAPTTNEPASKPQKGRHKFVQTLMSLDRQKVFGGFAIATLPVALLLLRLGQFGHYADGLVRDNQLYGVSVPVLLVAGICMLLGVLTLVWRKPWTVVGCAIAMASTASVYFGAMMAVNAVFPTDFCSLCFLVLLVPAIAGYRGAMEKSRHAKPMEILSEVKPGEILSDAIKPEEIQPDITHVGNISYTKWGLLMLFAWLLWFDFCFSMMEGVLGAVLSFRLVNELKAPNVLIGIMMGSIPALLGFFLTPVISVKSDRHRSPRGRRIPFLLWASPFVCALLALMGFSNDIGAWLHASVLLHVLVTR